MTGFAFDKALISKLLRVGLAVVLRFVVGLLGLHAGFWCGRWLPPVYFALSGFDAVAGSIRQSNFRERLDAIIDLKHPLVRLAELVPWSDFDLAFGR